MYEVAMHPDAARQLADSAIRDEDVRRDRRALSLSSDFRLLVFPRLALGLSGFETGVAVMPLVKSPNRIEKRGKLLMTAALIMSFMLIASSFITSVLIPRQEFCPRINCAMRFEREKVADRHQCRACESADEIATGAFHEAGKANGRALAYHCAQVFWRNVWDAL